MAGPAMEPAGISSKEAGLMAPGGAISPNCYGGGPVARTERFPMGQRLAKGTVFGRQSGEDGT